MIACYSRVSTSEQALNGHSIDEQNERMTKYCDAMGWKHHKLYTDGGYSGANMERPALQQLIRDVKAHRVDKVLVYKLDRLSRSQRDTLTLIEDVFLANGCDFVSMSENFDTATPFGRAAIGILAVFAQLEREQIKERMKMGKEARAKQGKFGGSNHVPIGYDYIDGELIPNEAEALQIRMIFNDFVGGMSADRIEKKLNDAGFRTKYGPWHVGTIRKLLTKRTYIGELIYHDEWYQGNHEPIIDRELFDRAQAIIDRTHQETIATGRRYGKAHSYLGGFIWCAECGNRYARKSANNKGKIYEYYMCNTQRTPRLAKGRVCHNKTWKKAELEELIFNEIKKLAFEDYKPQNPPDDRPRIIEIRLSEIDEQLSRLIDLYALGTLPESKLEGKIKELNEQKHALEEQLEVIRSEQKRITPEEAHSVAGGFDSVLASGDYDRIRSVLSALIDKIELDRDDITIFWAFS